MNTYISSFFSLPVKRENGEHLTYEQVVDKLDDETVSYDNSLGFSGLAPETLRVSLRVEATKYELAVAWLRDLIYGSEFDKDRLVPASSFLSVSDLIRSPMSTDCKQRLHRSSKLSRVSNGMATMSCRRSMRAYCLTRLRRQVQVASLNNQKPSPNLRKDCKRHQKRRSRTLKPSDD